MDIIGEQDSFRGSYLKVKRSLRPGMKVLLCELSPRRAAWPGGEHIICTKPVNKLPGPF